MNRYIALLLLIAAMLWGCTGGGPAPAEEMTPVPRRTGYPRIPLPEPSYTSLQDFGWNLEVNDIATAELSHGDGTRWITLSYPQLGEVALMFTLIPASSAEIPGILDNRAERINLNLGGKPGNVWEIEDSLLSGEIIVSNSISTPVQLIVTDNRSVVLTGAAFVPALTTATRDSLAPLVDYLAEDVMHLVSRFRPFK